MLHIVGLEYLIEIQHNTVKKMANNYTCLLCDHDVKVKNDKVDTVDLAINHVKSTQHRTKYVVSSWTFGCFYLYQRLLRVN